MAYFTTMTRVTFGIHFACVYDCIEKALLREEKDDGGVGHLNYGERSGLETGGFGWSPMSGPSLS